MRPAKHSSFLWFVPLVALGFLVAIYDYGFLKNKTPGESVPAVQAALALPQVKLDEVYDQGQYAIIWSNPRYETDLSLKPYAFMVDLELVNKSFPGSLQMIVNCDRDDATGLGVSFDEHDGFVVLPLEEGTKVVACRYTPTGAYDPNLAVEIRF